MSSYRRYYLPSVSWSDVKGGVWRIQPYNVTDYFFIFRVQNLLTSAYPICHGLIAYLLGDFSYNMNFSPPNLRHSGHIKTREYLQLSNDIFERITEYDDTNTNRSNKPDYML